MNTIILKPNREKSIFNRHPWVFSGGIANVQGSPQAGELVNVQSHKGALLGQGWFNPRSQIRVRLLQFGTLDLPAKWLSTRIKQAIQWRKQQFDATHTNAYRLIHSDGDQLPGLIVDQYNDVCVLQCHTLGMQQHKDEIVKILKQQGFSTIVERSDSQALKEEGAKAHDGVLAGSLPKSVQFLENGVRFGVDVLKGQKTGFFLDQRDNRQRMASWAQNQSLLNVCSYTGGFSAYAALQGATVTSLDISEAAQKQAIRNFELNDLSPKEHTFVTADVFDYLRKADTSFDHIVLDPPAFIKKRAHVTSGTRAYKDINRLAMQNIQEGGILMTCSCSYHMDWKLFQQVVFSAAKEANRPVQLIGRYSQPFDHPIDLFCPETEYLKTLVLRVGG